MGTRPGYSRRGNQFSGVAVGGRPYELAFDSELGHLYVVVKPTLQDEFTESKILTLDAATGKFLGVPIEVGTKVNSLHVNPRTHEIYAAAADDNRVSVVSPETWTVDEKIDFTELGVTSGYGTGEANLAVVTGNSTGDVAYVSHPYKERSRVSQLHRTGPTPAITPCSPPARTRNHQSMPTAQAGTDRNNPRMWQSTNRLAPST